MTYKSLNHLRGNFSSFVKGESHITIVVDPCSAPRKWDGGNSSATGGSRRINSSRRMAMMSSRAASSGLARRKVLDVSYSAELENRDHGL